MSQNAGLPPVQAWCLFQVRSRPHAVPLERVVEIVTVDHLARFPLGPRQLMGLFVLRRDVVPVLDLDPVPAGDPSYTEGKAVVLVLQTEHGMWGVRIDREGTLLVQGAPEPDEAADRGASSQGRRGRIANDGKHYVIIDPEASWSETRASVVAHYRPTSRGTLTSVVTDPFESDDLRRGSGIESVNPEAFTPKVHS